MQTFQVSTGPPPGPKNYVFVDEHNRHKRLKVMRACEGCRRRKIKCDAATTNTWPCGSCKRLKLTCVPPAGGIDGDINDPPDAIAVADGQHISASSFSAQFDTYADQFEPHGQVHSMPANQHEPQHGQTMYLQQEFGFVPHQSQAGHLQPPVSMNDYRYPSIDSSSQHSASTPKTPDTQTAEILTEQLGELKIGENGVAPYIRQQGSSGNEQAAPVEEVHVDPLPLNTTAGSKIRIPPELFPSEEDADECFRAFFDHVHPYIPVLCRSVFMHQWHSDRASISPLLLEAIFACAARVMGEPVGDSSWLALANKHEPSFLDTPRLSTVQALLLLLKAREGSPKKGYFYKSWLTLKTASSMAKDLEIHEHRAIHESGDACEFAPDECLVRTRIWQAILVLEMMIGAPQGRYDFSVDIDTVDFNISPPHSDIDPFEAKISRQHSYFVRNARNIMTYLSKYVKLRRKKDWMAEAAFASHNDTFKEWPNELPPDLSLHLPADGSAPRLSSHFLGNMHSHHQLGIIMLYRPQLTASKGSDDNQNWRNALLVSYTAAKHLCRLQEAVVDQFGLVGLLCMQRGMSFTIYSILTCTMLHLVAITSPDDEFNMDAREYFIRHMRLLEKCVPEWPMPETVQQIENLRTAFSADLEKPFDLKHSFPYGSPSDSHPSPGVRKPSDQPQYGYEHSGLLTQQWQQQQQQQSPQGSFSTASMSIGPDSSHSQQPFFHDYNQPQQQYRSAATTGYPRGSMPGAQEWNPTPIIDQFNTAFAIPQSALAPPSSSGGYSSSPPLSIPQQVPMQQHFAASPQSPTYAQNMFGQHHQQQTPRSNQQPQQGTLSSPPVVSQNQYFDMHLRTISSGSVPTIQSFSQGTDTPHQTASIQPQPHQPGMTYVTPKQWQQSVASVFDPGGLKRRWDWGLEPEPE